LYSRKEMKTMKTRATFWGLFLRRSKKWWNLHGQSAVGKGFHFLSKVKKGGEKKGIIPRIGLRKQEGKTKGQLGFPANYGGDPPRGPEKKKKRIFKKPLMGNLGPKKREKKKKSTKAISLRHCDKKNPRRECRKVGGVEIQWANGVRAHRLLESGRGGWVLRKKKKSKGKQGIALLHQLC